MATQQQFLDFLSDIEPSQSTKTACSAAHRTLREGLAAHPTYKDILKTTYLSGSYARNTALRPRQFDGEVRKPDVDIIVVTHHTREDRPSDVIATLRKAVKDLGYEVIESNRRSICVKLAGVEMDVVPIIPDPWEAGKWLIADKSEERWLSTNPKGHNDWAVGINRESNGNFVPLVKLLKWWKRENLRRLRRPKGFILETVVAELMSYSNGSYEELFAKLLESIAVEYEYYANSGQVPYLDDPSVDGNNVFSRVKPEEFLQFYNAAAKHAVTVRRAQRETDPDKALALWRRVFGERFPKPATKGVSLLRNAATPAAGLGLTFPGVAVVPPNKPPGFA